MNELSPTLQLACDLIARPSITPEDAGCQTLMMRRLQALGFTCTPLRFDDVDNFWAVRGSEGPVLCFAGHTDVVPTGPESQWRHPPFTPTIEDGWLYGRGSADMKGSLAAMITACERFLAEHPHHQGRIAFLITSDEEGPAVNGTVKVIDWLERQGEKITWCIVGEPSSECCVGDVIKNGRRGSLSGDLVVQGVQGHVAYPHKADNPIHRVAPVIAELAGTAWDGGNQFFPPTTFQISNMHAGTGATNVIPGTAELQFNFRFSTESDAETLKQRVQAVMDNHGLRYHLKWSLSGQPFITERGELVDACVDVIRELGHREPELSTSGGTSDGRFIAPTGAQVLELGPSNETIHKVDERVRVEDLDTLSVMYQRVMERLLTP